MTTFLGGTSKPRPVDHWDRYRCGDNSRVNDGSEVVARRKRVPGE
jgi:hypothetical protein